MANVEELCLNHRRVLKQSASKYACWLCRLDPKSSVKLWRLFGTALRHSRFVISGLKQEKLALFWLCPWRLCWSVCENQAKSSFHNVCLEDWGFWRGSHNGCCYGLSIAFLGGGTDVRSVTARVLMSVIFHGHAYLTFMGWMFAAPEQLTPAVLLFWNQNFALKQGQSLHVGGNWITSHVRI